MDAAQIALEEKITALAEKLVGDAIAKAMTKAGEVEGDRLVDKLANSKKKTGAAAYDQYNGKGEGAARFMRAAAIAKKDHSTLANAAKKLDKDGSGFATKALEAYDAVSGGFLIPEPVSDEIIELLRPRSVVMLAGPRVLPMPSGNWSFNLQTVSAISYYVGDCQAVVPSSQKFARQKLVSKKLHTLVPICNDFLDYAGAGADAFVRDDMVQAMSTKMDQAFLRGTGSEDSPKGLRYLAISANVNARTLSGGLSTIDTISADLNKMKTNLRLLNIPMIKPAWFMSPRTLGFLQALQNALGIERYSSLNLPQPMLLGYPVYDTTSIPVNLGGPADESEIILADMSQIVVGQGVDLRIASSGDASYLLGSTHHHGMQEDFTLISAIMAHDIMDLRQGSSISVLTTVDWY